MDTVDVLVVDDSMLMRNLVSRIIDSVSGLTIVATAMNGKVALEKLSLYKIDLIILDLNMPVMDGLEFLKERKKRNIDIPVIVLSSLAHSGAALTMECLELGASDFLLKPSGAASDDIKTVAAGLIGLIQFYGGMYARKKGKIITISSRSLGSTQKSASSFVKSDKIEAIQPLRGSAPIELIALGISTGGPNALRSLFPALSPDLQQPIVVVQHMPASFTAEFAISLNTHCPLVVKEAIDGDILKNGYIFIAPGDKHIVVERGSFDNVIRVIDTPLCNGHRPSVDILFESVATIYQNKALGIIMTGMGRDGATQLVEMRRQGARTIGQDEASSVVYGMPRMAYELGAVQEQVSLEKMAKRINTLCLA